MELAGFVDQVSDFSQIAPREQIQLLSWFLHTHAKKEVLTTSDIRACYSATHMPAPNVSQYLARMVDYGDLLKVRGGVKLSRHVRSALDGQYGVHSSVAAVSGILTSLPGRISDISESHFLAEVLKCYRVEAYRACIVMSWNLAYSHLLQWLLNDPARTSTFNSAISRRYPKKSGITINSYESFLDELKESEVIEICNTSGLLSGSIVKILKEKLTKRNTAAHPASVVITQSQADDAITDLVNNVVLKLQ